MVRGLSFALVLACVGTALAADKVVKIQPIQLAKDDGSGVVQAAYYEAYAQKIWAQAGITLSFLAPRVLNSTAYYNLDYFDYDDLFFDAGHQQNSDPLVINAYFCNSITNASVYGFALLNDNFLALDVNNILGYSATGRVDTFAHELGHTLTLEHWDDAHGGEPGANKHLMASGGIRLIPQTLANVAPDGTALDLLGASEIADARGSQFAQTLPVPEPASMFAVGAGILALCRRRRRS